MCPIEPPIPLSISENMMDSCCDDENNHEDDESEDVICRQCGEHACPIVCIVCGETLSQSNCCP